MRTRNSGRSFAARALLALLLGALLLSGASSASADEPKGKTLAECSDRDVMGKKDGCLDLYQKQCVKDGKANDSTKDCKRLNDQILKRPAGKGPSLGEKLCKGHDNDLCDITRDVSKGARKIDKAVSNPVDTIASAAFDAAAGKFGEAASTILDDMTSVFLDVSTIDLGNKDSGLLEVSSMTWALSSVVALLLLIWQFGKPGISGEESAAATVITGLAKWAVICMAALAVTQAALGATARALGRALLVGLPVLKIEVLVQLGVEPGRDRELHTGQVLQRPARGTTSSGAGVCGTPPPS